MLITTSRTLAVCFAAAFLVALYTSRPAAAPATQNHSGTIYKVRASNARWNHRVMSAPTAYVQGVPAEPVDSFVWDGVGSRELVDARITMELDPIWNRAIVRASWTDAYGKWTFKQVKEDFPHHWAGVRVGASVNDVEYVNADPVVTNVYLHGDTTAGPGVLPTVFAYAATWGLAEVTLNGQKFVNTFDPAANGDWPCHLMVTCGVRDDLDGSVRNRDGTIFDMSQPSNGARDESDIEVHITFHDEPDLPPSTANIPPLFEFFYHLVFEDVQLDISHTE
jgi:hypothetical protein